MYINENLPSSEKTGSLSREIHHIESNVKLVGIVGFFIGGLNETYKHTENFNRNNQLMLYSNKKDATVKLIILID
jgi:hypothetical protein